MTVLILAFYLYLWLILLLISLSAESSFSKATYPQSPPRSNSHTRQPINPGLLSCQKPYLNPVATGNAFSSSLSNSQMNLFPLNNRPNQNATPSLGDSGLTLSILNNQIENNFMSCFPTSIGNQGCHVFWRSISNLWCHGWSSSWIFITLLKTFTY